MTFLNDIDLWFFWGFFLLILIPLLCWLLKDVGLLFLRGRLSLLIDAPHYGVASLIYGDSTTTEFNYGKYRIRLVHDADASGKTHIRRLWVAERGDSREESLWEDQMETESCLQTVHCKQVMFDLVRLSWKVERLRRMALAARKKDC